jgi:hypothetical protein
MSYHKTLVYDPLVYDPPVYHNSTVLTIRRELAIVYSFNIFGQYYRLKSFYYANVQLWHMSLRLELKSMLCLSHPGNR